MQDQASPQAQVFAKVLRRGMTDAERALWRGLRMAQLGVKFRRQHPLGTFIADFACLSPKLIVELDGSQHANQQAYDQRRDAFLRSQGFEVLRFDTHEALRNPTGVLTVILAHVEFLKSGGAPIPAFPQRGKEQEAALIPAFPQRGKEQEAALIPAFPQRGKEQEAASIPAFPQRGKEQEAASIPAFPQRGKEQEAAPIPAFPQRGKEQSPGDLVPAIAGKEQEAALIPAFPQSRKARSLGAPDSGLLLPPLGEGRDGGSP